MYTTIRVLCIILVLLVAACGPRTAAEKQNYHENVKEMGDPRNHMNWGVIFATVVAGVAGVGVGWAAFWKYAMCVLSRCLTPTTGKMGAANLVFAAVLCVGVIFLCGMESCTEDTILEENPTDFLQAMPPSGSEIGPTATIIVNFDAPPTGLTANSSGPFSISAFSAEATITGPFIVKSKNKLTYC